MLYLISTPIGHLADITLRALEVMKTCDYLLCEDTRHSSILLQHYNIRKPLKSYHQYNEAAQSASILEDLEKGKIIGLLTDAGTPAIADPGFALVKLCLEHHIPFTALPGPCAAIQALCCSGLPTQPFQFWGFLSRQDNALRRELQTILIYRGTTICYVPPHRLLNVLSLLHAMQPDRPLVVARELTKKFEEFRRGLPNELLAHWQAVPVKGEIILLISPPSAPDWSEWSIEEQVAWLEKSFSLDRKEAIKLTADLRGVPKRDIYKKFL